MKRRFTNIIQIKMYYLYKERITGGQQMLRTRREAKKQPPEVFFKIWKFQKKTPWLESLFNKVAACLKA